MVSKLAVRLLSASVKGGITAWSEEIDSKVPRY
jgi:hypothetical protein